ncbi:diguanylate cyclase (GGDEF)-like protein [Paucibacter oligotrophus]|uniref:diguanylate cyclase n=1 Tax=Roseateles oligotrophus TaxID=1769250 RepID=A0A840L5U2_9BURK|nr:GGDEF domain-containing protein [Roseateles oligotrophus]MBB4843396.1 diguanylate cyclase (GGDEF)-like protein [Roseateles oligotrophus]
MNSSPLATDPFTLLAAMVLILLLAGLFWAAMASSLKVVPKVSACVALANLLVAGSLAAHALRGVAPDLLTFWGSDAMSLAGLAALRAGMPALSQKPLAWRSGLAIWLCAVGTLATLPYAGDLHPHSGIVYSGLALLAGLAALDTWRQLRSRVKPGLSALLSGPLFIICALLAQRALASFLQGEAYAPDLLDADHSNLAFLWATLAMNLLINATLAFLVLMKLILQIQQLTRQDPLTRVLNRRALQEAIETEHQRMQRGKPYALVMIDMDHFKQLNDSLGHAAGDAALQRLVEVLGHSVRDVDCMGRMGGEEFCVLLPLTDLAGAALVAERMRWTLEQSQFNWQGQPWPLTASFGIAEALPSNANADAVLHRADQGMYRAKAQGRNLVQAREDEG